MRAPDATQRATPGRRGPRVLTVVLAVYLLGVVWATFGPAPYEEMEAAVRGADTAGRAVLGRTADRPERGTHRVGARPKRREPNLGGLTSEEVANIAMFVPFGVLIPLRAPRWWWATIPAGACLSCLIEGVQLTLLEHRQPSWGDVRLNTLGVTVGLGLWLAARAVRSSTQDRAHG